MAAHDEPPVWMEIWQPRGGYVMVPATDRDGFFGEKGPALAATWRDERRAQLEAIPWVEQAAVRRSLPNSIEVRITERTPVAFLRDGSDLALVDVHGVILDRPLEGDFHFPVVTGIGADTALGDREQRMQLFSEFIQQIESVRAGAADQVSEIDLSDGHDLRATLTGFELDDAAEDASSGTPPATSIPVDTPVLVHFGDSDFAGKYQTLVGQFSQWRARAGRIESVDLRFSREAIVNQETTATVQPPPPKKAANALPH